jgi:hypothetical protein
MPRLSAKGCVIALTRTPIQPHELCAALLAWLNAGEQHKAQSNIADINVRRCIAS